MWRLDERTFAGDHVLVVDDNPSNTALVAATLCKGGIGRVTELQDSMSLAAVLRSSRPDLVVLDLRMPGLDGYAALDIIKAHAAGQFLPVIVVTADDSPDSVERALVGGANDLIVKPFRPLELVLRVRNLLTTRHAYQELRQQRTWLRSQLRVFEPSLPLDADNAEQMLARIRRTIDGRLFHVVLQPIVDMTDGRVVSHEALARFDAGDPPWGVATWFATALELGVVTELETAILQAVLEVVAQTGESTTRTAINLSPGTVLSDECRRLLDSAPLDRMTLELTEHTPVEDYAALSLVITPLRARGMKLAIDDAGSGFASLRHIVVLRPDVVKLDIGIVQGSDSDLAKATLIHMMAEFANRVGVDLVAEGVETVAERDCLCALGVRFGQGYLLGTPSAPTPNDA